MTDLDPELTARIETIVADRLRKRRNVRDPIKLGERIRGDILADHDANGRTAIDDEYDRITGNATPKGRPRSDAANYQVSYLDHAVTAALDVISRIDGDTGRRCFTDTEARTILLDEFPEPIVERALELAHAGRYRLAEPRIYQLTKNRDFDRLDHVDARPLLPLHAVPDPPADEFASIPGLEAPAPTDDDATLEP